MRFAVKGFCLISLSFFFCTLSYAQGDLIVNPLSSFETSKDKTITFTLNNRKNSAQQLNYTHICSVDGVDYNGTDCLKFVKVDSTIPIDKGMLNIPLNDKATLTVSLADTKIGYILYKPLIVPIEKTRQTYDNTVKFDFNYQPGFLYLVKPVKEKLEFSDTKYVNEENFRRIKMKAKLDKLQTPHVVSITAKIVDAESKKLVRLVKLATNKIVDPNRKVLEIYADYATPDYTKPVCYQAYVQDITAKEVYQLSDCK